MSLSITYPDGPIGAEIRGVDLAKSLTDIVFEKLLGVLRDRGVMVVRGHEISEADQVRFGRRFGTLQKILFSEHLVPGCPELFLVSNIIENGRPIGNTDAGRFWHTDGAYLAKPHMASMLYAIEVPQRNGRALGDTLFAGTAAAYDGLPASTKRRIENLRAVHSIVHRYEAKSASPEEIVNRTRKYPPASHPLAIRHPATGRRCLYVSEGYTSHVEGLPPAESVELLAELCAHVVQPEFQYRHRWEVDDLVVWDNRATLHKATFDYALPERRLMRRATVAGDALG